VLLDVVVVVDDIAVVLLLHCMQQYSVCDQ